MFQIEWTTSFLSCSKYNEAYNTTHFGWHHTKDNCSTLFLLCMSIMHFKNIVHRFVAFWKKILCISSIHRIYLYVIYIHYNCFVPWRTNTKQRIRNEFDLEKASVFFCGTYPINLFLLVNNFVFLHNGKLFFRMYPISKWSK